ncbi:MAG: 16S rRNA (guanine(527)-N(7))-methyltransferase RsmG, partial [Porticoccus sp.]
MSQSFASNGLELILREGLQQLSLALSDQQVSLLMEYLGLLEKWNGAYNLTSIREPEQMLRLHLLDSLSIAHLIKGERIIDVGTGPGLPGIPLAITYPERQFTLMDSNGKKTRFLFQVRTQLGLTNVTEIQSRVEEYQPTRRFDGVTSRAFTSLKDMVEKCAHLI